MRCSPCSPIRPRLWRLREAPVLLSPHPQPPCRQFEIERQQEGKRIGAVFHAVGFADGGIEGGDGGFKRVIAGIFDRAVKRAQGQAMFGAQGAAQAA